MHDLGIYFPQKASMQRGTFEFHAQAKAKVWKQRRDTDIINTSGRDESLAINVTEIVKNQDRENLSGIKEKWIEGRDRSILGKSFSKYTFELYFALDRGTPSSRRIARWGWKSVRTGLATLLNEFSTVSRVVVSHCPCTQLRGHVTFPLHLPLHPCNTIRPIREKFIQLDFVVFRFFEITLSCILEEQSCALQYIRANVIWK